MERTWTVTNLTVACRETYLHYCMKETFKPEQEAYRSLLRSQGKHVPGYYCEVKVLEDPHLSPTEFAAIPGVLLDYLDEFPF